jgi:MinD-like ATPase involved in chromosome partitioning or flagellar assembly
MTLTEPKLLTRKEIKTQVITEPQLITVWGPAGATGKSTIALNLSYELTLLGQRVILLDLDTSAPALNLLLPITETSAGLAGAARLIRQGRFGPEELDRLSICIKHGRNRLRFLPGLPSASRWAEITPDTIEQLIAVCKHNFDIIVTDVSSSIEDALTAPDSPTSRNSAGRTAITHSTRAIVCLADSKLSVARYLNAFSVLNQLQKERVLVMNRSQNSSHLANAIRSLTKERIDFQIPNDEPALQLAESQLLPLALARRKSPARNAIAALAHKLLAWAP